MVPNHANAIEWVWLILTIVGICMALISTIDAFTDLRYALRARANIARYVLAISNFRCEVKRLILQVVGFVTALVSVYLPPPPPYQYSEYAVIILMSASLLTVSAATAVVSFLEYRERLLLREMVQHSSHPRDRSTDREGQP